MRYEILTIDAPEEAILARFAAVSPSDLTAILQIEEVFGISEVRVIFEDVVGIHLTSEDETVLVLAILAAAQHGDLLRASPVDVVISGDSEQSSGYLFHLDGELWINLTPRRLNFRLLAARVCDDFELNPQAVAASLQRIFIDCDELGFLTVRLECTDLSVMVSGGLCDFLPYLTKREWGRDCQGLSNRGAKRRDNACQR